MLDKSKIKIAFLNILINAQDILKSKPDVILMDIQLPGMTGIDAMRLIKENFPEIKILMETIFENEKGKNSFSDEPDGYTIKTSAPIEISGAVPESNAPMSAGTANQVLKMFKSHSTPAKGQSEKLSLREKEILSCLAEGMSYKMIADYCFISIDTVSGHMRHIYKKLQVHSKGEAVAKAIRGRIV